MKKFLKILAWTIGSIFLLLVIAMATFMYKVKNGFPVSYETEQPSLQIPANANAVLVFSKTTGFRHGESIDASIPVINDLAKKNQWTIYQTEEGGVFNAEQLAKFK